MNAPATAATVAIPKPTLEILPLTAIAPSGTHIQELRRARFDKKALQELADSIKVMGVLQPIVVRPAGLADKYELVAGERRWMAAKLAGLTEIRASVCALSPEQVLEVQLVENLQREGLHELEEAEGYEELMKLKKINADAIAGMVGKSRSYVYARTKLLALCPEARKAFYAGELDASRALLVARIGHHDTQRQAMKDLAGNKWDGPMSYRQAHQHVLQRFMLKLKQAPFAVDDATLLPKAGACGTCPKRTGNQKELFADVNDADVCTDPKCFDEKRAAHWARKRQALEKTGKKVISGPAAKQIFPYGGETDARGGMSTLASTCWDDPKNRKVVDIVGKDSAAIQYVQHPESGALIPVVPSTAITEALNAKGVKTHRQKVAAQTSRSQSPVSKKNEEREDQIAALVNERALKLALGNASGALGLPELRLLADDFWRRACEDTTEDIGDALYKAFGWKPRSGYSQPLPKEVAKFGAKDLGKLITVCAMASALDAGGLSPEEKAIAKTLKLDLKAIEKEVRAEFKKKDDEAKKKTPVAKVMAAIEKRAKKSSKKK